MIKGLKPCPFCGDEDRWLKITITDREDRTECRFTAKVECLRCSARNGTHGFHWTDKEAKEEAIKQWNRRA